MRQVKKKKFSVKTRLYLGGFVLIVLGAVAFWFSPYGVKTRATVRTVTSNISDKAHLVLDQVTVEGHKNTSITDINKTLDLAQNMPMLDIDLKESQEKLLTLPWIDSVIIERHLPSTLYIRIKEKEPIAVWQQNKKYLPLDAHGKPIQDDKTALSDLILVVGSDAPRHTPELIETLKKYPDILARVRSAIRQGERRWDLMLNDASDGLVIALPETEIEAALARLKKADAENHLLNKDLQRIDVRHADRLITRLREVKKK